VKTKEKNHELFKRCLFWSSNSKEECVVDVQKCPKCKKESSEAFCCKCGSAIEVFKEKGECDRVEHADEIMDNEELNCITFEIDPYKKGVELFIGNDEVKDKKYFNEMFEGSVHLLHVEKMNPVEEIEKFSKAYEKEIELLKKAYGDDKVSVDFRIVTLYR
jgi:hypothetical protein